MDLLRKHNVFVIDQSQKYYDNKTPLFITEGSRDISVVMSRRVEKKKRGHTLKTDLKQMPCRTNSSNLHEVTVKLPPQIFQTLIEKPRDVNDPYVLRRESQVEVSC